MIVRFLADTISFIFQFLLLIGSYLLVLFFFSEELLISRILQNGLMILIISWLLTAWLTHKFKLQFYQKKFSYVIAPFIKALFFHLFFVSLFSVLFYEISFKNYLLIASSISYLFIELLIFSLIILIKGSKFNNNKNKLTEARQYTQAELEYVRDKKLIVDLSKIPEDGSIFNRNIIDEFLKSENSETLIEYSNFSVFKTISEIKNQGTKLSLCILDIRINDLLNIDKTLKDIYLQLQPGGYLFLAYRDLKDFEADYLNERTRIYKALKKLHYYLYFRILPKIPYLNIIYTLLSGGKNKVISRAEMLGRLAYCGYNVEKQLKRNNYTFFEARKTLTLSENPKPSYYPVIKLNRVSLYGNIIKIHKVRSMYPYSEFIQKRVFEEMSLNSNGKFENDYRITEFGKIIRKYWIDELPQFLDWFRGKIKLVGIRAMSQHFFSLYPQEYKDLYLRVKPGIISPIFDENTAGFDHIVQIEKKYLESYIKNPVRTDIKYFFLTFTHILRGVRSK